MLLAMSEDWSMACPEAVDTKNKTSEVIIAIVKSLR